MISLTDAVMIINQYLPEPHAGLLAGIIFGVRTNLPAELKTQLINTGTIHITALSGMNITILVNLTATTLLRVFSRRIASLLSVLIIIGFVSFVGPSPSVVRASIMGILSLLAVVFGRQQRAFVFLVLTILIMIFHDRQLIVTLSFQLSVLSTLGIVLFASPLKIITQQNSTNNIDFSPSEQSNAKLYKMTKLIPAFLFEDLKTTVSAQLFTVPLIAYTFHRVSLIAPLANVCIGVLIAPLTVLGMLMVVLGLLYFPLAIIPSYVLYWMLSYILAIIEIFASLPFASFSW